MKWRGGGETLLTRQGHGQEGWPGGEEELCRLEPEEDSEGEGLGGCEFRENDGRREWWRKDPRLRSEGDGVDPTGQQQETQGMAEPGTLSFEPARLRGEEGEESEDRGQPQASRPVAHEMAAPRRAFGDR